jgi:hypothetical protein
LLVGGVILFEGGSLIAATIFGSWINGVILGVVVAFWAEYVLYKIGSYRRGVARSACGSS